jgi:hypothetical protein
MSPKSTVKVFVSHAHANKLLAREVALLLERALRLEPSQIRCSSATDYRFKFGKRLNDAIQSEIISATTCVALLTKASLQSSYVMFELGARWGAELSAVPFVALDASVKDIPGPLRDLVAGDARLRDDILLLVSTVAEELRMTPRATTEYNTNVDSVLQAAKGKRSGQRTARRGALPPNLSKRILSICVRVYDDIEDFYVDPRIPAQISRNARERLKLAGKDKLLAFVDNSHRGVNGLAIHSNGLTWKNDGRSDVVQLAWERVAGLRAIASGETVKLGTDYEIDLSGSEADASDVARVLRTIQAIL